MSKQLVSIASDEVLAPHKRVDLWIIPLLLWEVLGSVMYERLALIHSKTSTIVRKDKYGWMDGWMWSARGAEACLLSPEMTKWGRSHWGTARTNNAFRLVNKAKRQVMGTISDTKWRDGSKGNCWACPGAGAGLNHIAHYDMKGARISKNLHAADGGKKKEPCPHRSCEFLFPELFCCQR